MYSGKKVLASINSSLDQINEQLRNSEQELELLNNEQVDLEKSAIEQFRKLAKLRLNLLASDQIVQGLDASERHAEELLDERAKIRDELKQQIARLNQERTSLEQFRDKRAQDVDLAADTLDKKEVEIQKNLSINNQYQQQLLKYQQAERVAAHAKEKTELSRKDRIIKGQPYKDDTLFMYLWNRKYGSTDYHANVLIRYLDKKVAYLCRYDNARANYKTLTELPVRLQEHADIKRNAAEIEFKALKEIEQVTATKAGVKELYSHLDAREKDLQLAEEKLEIHEARVLALHHRETAFTAGDDKEFREIIQLLIHSFQKEDLAELFQDATQTPLAEDDIIVSELQHIKQSQQQLLSTQSMQRKLLKEQQQRQSGLKLVQRLFKQNRYDAITSVFSDGAKVNLLLNQYLNGILDSNHLWSQLQTMQKNQAVYSDLSFGSGEFPDGSWRGGRSSRIRNGGFSFPDSTSVLSEIAGGILDGLSQGSLNTRGSKRGRESDRNWGGGGFKTGGGF